MDEAEPQPDTTPRFAADTFSGSRFLFWSLSPVLALAIVAALMGLGDRSAGATAATLVWVTTCAAMILALYNPRRFGWAVRLVTGAVFLACAAYLVDEVFLSNKPIAPTRRSEASPWNSIHAFVLFGVPSFWLTVRGLRRRTAAAPE